MCCYIDVKNLRINPKDDLDGMTTLRAYIFFHCRQTSPHPKANEKQPPEGLGSSGV